MPAANGKGKGKADDQSTTFGAPRGRAAIMDQDAKTTRAELERLKNELTTKNELLAAQSQVIESVKSSLTCNVCLDVLDAPFALHCGHIFCYTDLYSWFHRPDPEAIYQNGQESTSQLQPSAEAASVSSPTEPASAGVNNHTPLPMLSATRRKNLVCPQCRASTRYQAPLQLYAVKEAASALRQYDTEGSSRPAATLSKLEAIRDKTWGGIFPATTMRNGQRQGHPPVAPIFDDADFVRRCSLCLWEVDDSGVCEGCGNIWSDLDDSGDEGAGSADQATLYGSEINSDNVNHYNELWGDDADAHDDVEFDYEDFEDHFHNHDEYESDGFVVSDDDAADAIISNRLVRPHQNSSTRLPNGLHGVVSGDDQDSNVAGRGPSEGLNEEEEEEEEEEENDSLNPVHDEYDEEEEHGEFISEMGSNRFDDEASGQDVSLGQTSDSSSDGDRPDEADMYGSDDFVDRGRRKRSIIEVSEDSEEEVGETHDVQVSTIINDDVENGDEESEDTVEDRPRRRRRITVQVTESSPEPVVRTRSRRITGRTQPPHRSARRTARLVIESD